MGKYQLALMNVETGVTEPLPSFDHAKNINPQWSPDGRTLYFVSDRGGISNIYKMDVASGKISQMTNLYVGISGITALSPALSVAQNANRLVYSTFEEGNYSIYSIDSLGTRKDQGVAPLIADINPAALSPINKNNDLLVHQLSNPELGLPADSDFATTNYHPSLSLEGIGQGSLAVGSSPFGPYFGGGISLLWSDMLGNQDLATALQIQSGGGFSFTDVAAMVGYLNSSHRLSWGGVIQQVPYILSDYASGYGYINGDPSYIEQQYIFREIDRQVSGILSYPFSQVMRTEFSLGYQNIIFRGEVDTRAVSLNTGLLTLDDTQDAPYIPALNMGTASAALVYDNSLSGATSPILGERYRLQVSPVVGSLTWTDVLADYRQYIMPLRPFTIAGRILHSGRYGKSAEDYRLAPLFLGYPGLVRGYDPGSFTADEFAVDSAGSSPFLNQLEGSKLFVGNLELRFPLLGVFGIGSGYYGYLPIECAFFYDAGVAWQNNSGLWIGGGPQKPITSAGVALRINLFGVVGEVDYVHPYDRPQKSWLWQFNLMPGF